MTEYTMTLKRYTELTPAETKLQFAAVADSYFNCTTKWKSKLADTLGVTSDGVYGWFRKGKKPPRWAFITLGALVENKELKADLRQIKHARMLLAKYP